MDQGLHARLRLAGRVTAAPLSVTAAQARRAWLREVGGPADGAGRIAALFQLLDVAGAAGFAAGLAWAMSALPDGAGAAAPGALLAIGAGLLRAISCTGSSAFGAAAAEMVKRKVRRDAARRLFAAAPGSSTLGASLALVVEGVEALDGWFARFRPARAAAAVSPLVVAGLMALASPVSAIIVLATFVPFVAAMALAGGAAADESRRQFAALRRLSGVFADRVRSLPVLLAFGAEAATSAELGRAADELARRTLRVLRIAFVSSAALEFFAALSVALVAAYCGFDLLGLLPFPAPEKLDLFRAVFVLALAPEAYAPLRGLASTYHDRQAAETAADVLASLPDVGSALPVRRSPGLRLEHVTFGYDAQDAPVLRNFTLVVAPGEIVALLDPTGAGKSTVLHLALGLLQAETGRVERDGLAAWAGQSPVVIPGTLAENVRLASRDAPSGRIEEACRLSGLAFVPGGCVGASTSAGPGFQAGSAGGWLWPAPSCGTPPCCCSTSRPPTWTPAPRSSCFRCSAAPRRVGPR